MNKPNVKCTKCGWISFALTKRQALAEIEQFNVYYDSLTEKEQKDYYGGKKSGAHNYKCQLCNGVDFVLAKEEEIPFGSTINPVIWDKLG